MKDVVFSLKKSNGQTLSGLTSSLGVTRLPPATTLHFKPGEPPAAATTLVLLRPELAATVQEEMEVLA